MTFILSSLSFTILLGSPRPVHFATLFPLLNPHNGSCTVLGSSPSVSHRVSCDSGQWTHTVGATPGPWDWGIPGTALAGAGQGLMSLTGALGFFCLFCASELLCGYLDKLYITEPASVNQQPALSHPRPLRNLWFRHLSALPTDLNLTVIFLGFWTSWKAQGQ